MLRIGYHWIVLLISTIAQMSVSLVTQGIPTLGPFFQNEFHLTRAAMGMCIVLINGGAIFVLALAGKAVDRFGEKRVIAIGGTSVGITAIGLAFANSFFSTLTLIFIIGLWYASATPGGSKAIMNWFPRRQRGMAMGIRQTGIPLGGMFAAAVLPYLAVNHGWRLAILAAGFTAIIGSLVFFVFYKEPPEQAEEKPYQDADFRMTTKLVLTDPNFLSVACLSITLAIGQSSVVFYYILYSTEALLLPLFVGSYLLAVAQLAGVWGRILWGVVSDKFFRGKRRVTLMMVLIVGASTTLLLAFLKSNQHLWIIYIVTFLVGFSLIGWNGMFITFVSELGGYDKAGSTVGIALTASQIGYIFGPPLFGLLVDLSGSYCLAWATLSVLFWSSILLFRFIREPIPKGTKKCNDETIFSGL